MRKQANSEDSYNCVHSLAYHLQASTMPNKQQQAQHTWVTAGMTYLTGIKHQLAKL